MGSSQSANADAGVLTNIVWAPENSHTKEALAKTFTDAHYQSTVAVMGGNEPTLVGGTDGVFGGGKLKEYAESIYSKNKEKLIRNIAEEVFKALKLQGARYAQTADISAVVNHLKKVVPNPRSKKPFNKSFTSGKQKQVCDVLANALNTQYGSKMIDMNAEPSVKCRQVSEVMHSLLLGLHTEFMSVAGDVVAVLKNMQTLREFIKASYQKQADLVEQSGDAGLKDQSASTKELFDRVLGELDRQMAIVGNVMNVSVTPAGKELISLLKDNKDFVGMVGDLKADLGSNEFGRKIAYMLSGVSSVAHSAAVIQRELKKIGLSVREFKNAKNLGELRAKLYAAIQKKSPNSKELDRLMKAYNVIMNHNYNHEAVSRAIKGGDDQEVAGGSETKGGDDDDDDNLPLYWSKKSLSKKIKNKKKFREMILKEFRNQLRAHYQRIVRAGDGIAKNIGNSIPLSEELDIFIRHIKDLPQMTRDNMYIVLSGYSKNVQDISERETFISQYRAVEQALGALSKSAGGSAFKPMQQAINGMLKLIDDFNDKMVKAITEITPDRPDEIAREVRSAVSDVYGSAENDTNYINSFVAFKKVQNDLDYYHRIAVVRDNLKRTAVELKTYGNDYEAVLGEEAGWLINQIRKEYNAELAGLKENPTEAEKTDRGDAIRASGVGDVGVKAALKATRSLLEQQRDAKIKMIEVAQAVDLYLRSFANGLVNHPDSVKSVVKMLDQVDIVANWFNERSGDNLAALFECFPDSVDANGTAGYQQATENDVIKDDGDVKAGNLLAGSEHYYQWLHNTANVAVGAANRRYPGLPTVGIPVLKQGLQPTQDSYPKKRVNSLLKLSKKAVHSMRALENILSAFKKVGEKFGDLQPQSHTFMNPGQIFNALVDYMACSSFTSHFAPGDNYTSGAAPAAIPAVRVDIALSAAAARAAVAPTANTAVPTYNTAERRAVNVDTMSLAGKRMKNEKATSADVMPRVAGNISGVSSDNANPNDNLLQGRKHSSVAMASIQPVGFGIRKWDYHDVGTRASITKGNPTKARVDVSGWRDDFYDTDLLFEMTIKSIVAKVFTVVDAYRLFNRPTTERSHSDSLNPLRSIMGGADVDGGAGADGGAMKSHVKINDQCTELYLRLPLLAEWYREMFGLDRSASDPDNLRTADYTDSQAHTWRASMVPSVDGVWSDLIHIVFDKANYVNEGTYTESIAQELIEAINKIYKAYRARGKTSTRDIIIAFVAEMNRVFGFLRTADIKAYLEDRKANRNAVSGSDIEEYKNYLDYDILDSKNQFGRNAAPSDKFINVGMGKKTRDQRVMVHLQKAIVDLRKRMDASLRTVSDSGDINNANGVRFGFTNTLRTYNNEIKNANSDGDKYKIVLNMMQSGNKLLNVSTGKLIMVHEAVAAPILALQRAVNVAWRFNNQLHALNVASLNRWNEFRLNGGGHAAAAANNAAAALVNTAKEWFKKEYPDATDSQCKDFATELVGIDGLVAAANNDYSLITGAAANNPVNLQYEHIFRTLMSSILDLGQDPNKLVQVSVSSTGNVSVDLSGLQELCEQMLGQVKRNINEMRSEFTDAKLLNKYVDVSYQGSTTNLADRINIVFKDSRKSGLGVGVGEKLTECLEYFRTNAANILAGDHLGNALNTLLFYKTAGAGAPGVGPDMSFTVNDLTKFPFNVIPTRMNQVDMTQEQKVGLAALKAGTPPDATAARLNTALRIPVLHGMGPADIESYGMLDLRRNSLMTALNRVVHNYLRDNLEPGVNKIYAPLFESFMNGAGANEVIQSNGFPNVGNFHGHTCSGLSPYQVHNRCIDVNNRENYGGPPKNGLLWNSTGMAMVALANEVDVRLKKKRHVYESLAEIPEFMKERMRCNLPYYSKILGIIAKRATLYRDLVQYLGVCGTDLVLPSNNARARDLNNMVDGQPQLEDLNMTRGDYRTYLMGQAHHIAELALDLKKCNDRVYKELQDTSQLFMQVSRDFISDYKARHGVKPLMPASNVLLPQRAMGASLYDVIYGDNKMLLLPTNKNGSYRYKFNYAARLLLARSDVEPSMDHMPGAKDLYNEYASSSGKHSLNIQDYAKTVLLMVKLARYLNDGTYSRLFGVPSGRFGNIGKDDGTVVGGRWRINLTDQDELNKQDLLGAGNAELRVGSPTNDALGAGYVSANKADRIQQNAANDNRKKDPATGADIDITNNLVVIGATTTNRIQLRFLNDAKKQIAVMKSQTNARLAIASPFVGMSDDAAELMDRCRFSTNDPDVNTAAYAGRLLQDEGGNPVGIAPANVTAAVQALAQGNDTPGGVRVERFYKLSPKCLPNRVNMSDAIVLTENPNSKAGKEQLAGYISDTVDTRNVSRRRMRTYNILDMNIVPLNVHAFMREVPFVNILNYSYTFDRMVHDFVLPDYVSHKSVPRERNRAAYPNQKTQILSPDNLMISPNDAVFSTRGLMVKLLTHPWALLNRSEYYGVLGSLFNGNDNMKLGRPRYLSDQLWHKVLLTSSSQETPDRIGANNPPQTELSVSAYEAQRQVISRTGLQGTANISWNDGDGTVGNPNTVQTAAAVGIPANRSITMNMAQKNRFEQSTHGGIHQNAVYAYLEHPHATGTLRAAGMPNVDNAIGGHLVPPESLWNALNASGVISSQPRKHRDAFGALRDNVRHAQEIRQACEDILAPYVRQAILSGDSGQLWRIVAALAHNRWAVPGAPANAGIPAGAPGPGNNAAHYRAQFGQFVNGIGEQKTQVGREWKKILQSHAANNNIFNTRAAGYDSQHTPNRWAAAGLQSATEVAAVVGNTAAQPGTRPRILNGESWWLQVLDDMLSVLTRAPYNLPTRMCAEAIVALTCALSGATPANMRNIFNASRVGGNNIADAPLELCIQATDHAAGNAQNDVGLAALVFINFLPQVYAMNISKFHDILYEQGNASQPDRPLPSNDKERAFVLPGNGPVLHAGMKYLKKGRWTGPGNAARAAGDVLYLAEVGYNRFNTKLVRNLTWLVQLQRLMRVVMVDHLSWINTPVVKGLKIADPKITEFDGRETWDEDDYNGNKYELI